MLELERFKAIISANSLFTQIMGANHNIIGLRLKK
jgi:hypothetical protein